MTAIDPAVRASLPMVNAVEALVDFSLLRILVLEDRLVNQAVIQRQLKQLNATCTFANNGVEGLAQLERSLFDIILADCSMPVMDGFVFTETVRRREQEAGDGRQIPIIALTADALPEDVEKCHAAGMNDVLSKPVSLDRLASVITQWAGKKTPDKGKLMTPTEPESPIDIAALVALIGGEDKEALGEIFSEFMAAAHTSFAEVVESAKRGDLIGLSAAAHGAKGEARNVGARRLGDLYAEIDVKAKARDAEATEIVAAVGSELARVEVYISTYLKQNS